MAIVVCLTELSECGAVRRFPALERDLQTELNNPRIDLVFVLRVLRAFVVKILYCAFTKYMPPGWEICTWVPVGVRWPVL